MNSARSLSDFEQTIVRNVDEHGCMILHAFDPEERKPDFSYSIGFPKTVDQPDVIIFGLPKGLMARMINNILRQISDEGLRLADGTRIEGLLEGFDCIAREIVDPTAIAEHFGSAIWYSRSQCGAAVDRAYQIVWPGAQQGLFPWETGCVQDVIDTQPALYPTSLNS